MGMYTELIFGAELKEDTPKKVIENLKYLTGELELEKPPKELKDFWFVLRGASYYFGVSNPTHKLWFDEICKSWHLSSRSNIKNYENEIEKFLEWIKPYISQGSGYPQFYAIVTYEDGEPKIYYMNDNL